MLCKGPFLPDSDPCLKEWLGNNSLHMGCLGGSPSSGPTEHTMIRVSGFATTGASIFAMPGLFRSLGVFERCCHDPELPNGLLLLERGVKKRARGSSQNFPKPQWIWSLSPKPFMLDPLGRSLDQDLTFHTRIILVGSHPAGIQTPGRQAKLLQLEDYDLSSRPTVRDF